MEGALLNWYQALQLLALGPCLFMIFFLCVAARNFTQILVPLIYFVSLACSFCLPLVDVVSLAPPPQVIGGLMLGESLSPGMSFLLIVQFMTNRMPRPMYWLILALPLIGGSSLVYATLIAKGELCIRDQICADPVMLRELYEIFSSAVIFLLSIVEFRRLSYLLEGTPHQREHKYALVIALVLLNLIILGIDLARVSAFGNIDPNHAALAVTVVRIGFIYIVLTSVFRVFDRALELALDRLPSVRSLTPTARDLAVAAEVTRLMEQDKLYRTMDLSRAALAKKLAVPEHYLSRIINQCLGQNFNALINQYRVEEAKLRLRNETTPITVIAFEVGFASLSSFNRVFKNMAGTTPGKYRNSEDTA